MKKIIKETAVAIIFSMKEEKNTTEDVLKDVKTILKKELVKDTIAKQFKALCKLGYIEKVKKDKNETYGKGVAVLYTLTVPGKVLQKTLQASIDHVIGATLFIEENSVAIFDKNNNPIPLKKLETSTNRIITELAKNRGAEKFQHKDEEIIFTDGHEDLVGEDASEDSASEQAVTAQVLEKRVGSAKIMLPTWMYRNTKAHVYYKRKRTEDPDFDGVIEVKSLGKKEKTAFQYKINPSDSEKDKDTDNPVIKSSGSI